MEISENERINLLTDYTIEYVNKVKESMLDVCDKVKADKRLNAADLMSILSSACGAIMARQLVTNFHFDSIIELGVGKEEKYKRSAESLAMMCMQAIDGLCSKSAIDQSMEKMTDRLINALFEIKLRGEKC